MAEVVQVDGGRQVTLRGITVTVLDEAIDDFELLEDLARIQNDEKQRGLLPNVLHRLLGDAGFRAVMDRLRGTNGRVPVKAGISFVEELFKALSPNS
jgi:hypothetical protein